MPTYRVMHKYHGRATYIEETHHDAYNNPYTVRQPGPLVRCEVGTLMTDVTPEELAAFPERFQFVSEDPPAGALGMRQHHQTIHPELYVLLARAHAGDATEDEQALVGPLLAFMASHVQDTATHEDAENLQGLLTEFGLSLFAN